MRSENAPFGRPRRTIGAVTRLPLTVRTRLPRRLSVALAIRAPLCWRMRIVKCLRLTQARRLKLTLLYGGRSLLPAGVRAVEGTFQRGDPVVVRALDGKAVARGLSAYASIDAERIAGHRSDEIEAILGWRGRDEVIHRDDLVLL